MVRSWQPKTNHDDALSHGFNSSFNNSFSNNSSTTFTSPRKFGSRTKSPPTTRPSNAGAGASDFESAPRFQLFETKAEIQYLDDDRLAASVYADRHSIKKETKPAPKPRTSGYDFDSLLKDVNMEDYRGWKK